MRTVLVQLPDGTVVDKPFAAVQPGEQVLVGGPSEFERAMRLQRELEAEIQAAGGLDAWCAGGTPLPQAVAAAAARTVTAAVRGADQTFTFTLPP